MRLVNWWKRWKRGDAVCKVANAEALNRVYNVLEDLEVQGLNGIDAQIDKPTGAGGKGWTITIDGYALSVKCGGGGGTGLTGSKTVVLSVDWDAAYHKWTKTTETWTFTNGLLTSVSAATTSDIVTAVEEMP